MKSKWWWLDDHYWNADMGRVLENHLKFIERQKSEVVSVFYGNKIKANDGVYHPMEGSSTHFIGDALFRLIKPGISLLEIGCGTGALSCIAATLGAKRVLATDISQSAYDCAQENVKSLGLDSTVEVVKSNLFNSVPAEQFDVIVFNPPLLHCEPIGENLIGKKEYDEIAIDHECKVTLDFIGKAKPFLKKGGTLMLLTSNIGNRQKIAHATEMLSELGVVTAASAMYRNSGQQWRFVLSVQAN